MISPSSDHPKVAQFLTSYADVMDINPDLTPADIANWITTRIENADALYLQAELDCQKYAESGTIEQYASAAAESSIHRSRREAFIQIWRYVTEEEWPRPLPGRREGTS